MKAYIQTDKSGNFYNVNAYVANEGFQTLGWETEKYFSVDEITDNDPESLIVGGIGNVRKRLEKFGVERPSNEIDYPKELEKYLGRKVWVSTIEEIFRDEQKWNIFIKPKKETKKFVGKVVKDYKDFIGIVDNDNPTQIWCSEIVNFKTEWRCFIRYGEILDVRQYKGVWDSKIDLSVIKNAIKDFESSPASYALDFGIDDNDTMKLVEINDGHSLGTYGISPINYAKFLSARWSELTKTKDYARF
ncbi:ATP-grasp domain-containing protein [Flavobacterium sp. C3NV]|uniref:ATP-grasp domain-containing protein n=1 Tax=Flavobacterium sp. C3NV TaxID=3393358 RepID=UPI00398FBA9C